MQVKLRTLSAMLVIGLMPLPVWPASRQPSPQQPATHAAPAQPRESPASAGPDYTVKVDSTLVNVEVLVTDEDGRVLSGLKKGNFRILDNGTPREILDFSPTAEPITIVLLLEHSALAYSYFASKAAWWGNSFLDHLEPRDYVALVTYDIRPKVLVDFTRMKGEVREKLSTLGPGQFHESNLFGAMDDTLDKLERVRGKKAILLMSTGMNTFSGSTLDDVLNHLKRSDVKVFCLGLAEQEYVRSGGSGGNYLVGKAWLNSFAEITGGIATYPRFEGELPDVFRSVVGFLRNEYSLSFRPPKASRDGKYHRLKVEIVGPDGKQLKVTNEKGKRRKVIVYARQGYTAPRE